MFYLTVVQSVFLFWGEDLHFFRGNVHEDREGPCGFNTANNKAEGSVIEGRDMAAGDSSDSP